MLRLDIILVRKSSCYEGVGVDSRLGRYEVGKVNRMVVEVVVLDERECNLTSYGLGKGSR